MVVHLLYLSSKKEIVFNGSKKKKICFNYCFIGIRKKIKHSIA